MRACIHGMNRHVRGSGRRRGPRHDAAILDACRRPGHVVMGVSLAEITGVRWRSTDVIRYLRAAQGSFGQVLSAAIDRLPIHELTVRSRSDGVHIVRVRIIEIPVAIVIAVEVVNERVVDIDVAPVPITAVVPRMERFAPA